MSPPAHIRMNRATPEMRDFAGRLIAYEARLKKSLGMKTPVNFPVLERLRPHLATFMGNAGFRALLLRALALAGEEVPWLCSAQVGPNGSMEVRGEHKAQLSQNEIFEGRVELLAQLLGLLVAFIGEKLTLQLVLDVWPRLPVKDFNFSKGDRP